MSHHMRPKKKGKDNGDGENVHISGVNVHYFINS